MIIKGLLDEDIVNYKEWSMFLSLPYCTFKCEKECGIQCCQNSPLALQPNIEVSIDKIIDRYLNNNITHAIVLGGLEPLDSWEDVQELVGKLRSHTNDDIVIYTGYREDEIESKIQWLKQFQNIIVKFGRFIPDQPSHRDTILGVNLASPNQYAVKIS